VVHGIEGTDIPLRQFFQQVLPFSQVDMINLRVRAKCAEGLDLAAGDGRTGEDWNRASWLTGTKSLAAAGPKSGSAVEHSCNDGERAFKKVSQCSLQQTTAAFVFSSGNNEWRGTMRKLPYVLAALAIVGVGVPTAASAGGFGVYVGGDRGYYGDRYYGGPRYGFYGHDRGLHRGWYHRNYYGDREVVIRRHYWDD
jgi:hypothetical protein